MIKYQQSDFVVTDAKKGLSLYNSVKGPTNCNKTELQARKRDQEVYGRLYREKVHLPVQHLGVRYFTDNDPNSERNKLVQEAFQGVSKGSRPKTSLMSDNHGYCGQNSSSKRKDSSKKKGSNFQKKDFSKKQPSFTMAEQRNFPNEVDESFASNEDFVNEDGQLRRSTRDKQVSKSVAPPSPKFSPKKSKRRANTRKRPSSFFERDTPATPENNQVGLGHPPLQYSGPVGPYPSFGFVPNMHSNSSGGQFPRGNGFNSGASHMPFGPYYGNAHHPFNQPSFGFHGGVTGPSFVPNLGPNYRLERSENGNFGVTVNKNHSTYCNSTAASTAGKNQFGVETTSNLNRHVAENVPNEMFQAEVAGPSNVDVNDAMQQNNVNDNSADVGFSVEQFCESLIDPRGGIVELEKLSQENPALYQMKLANLRATFSVFPGEACLYYKYGDSNNIFNIRPFLSNRCGIFDTYQEPYLKQINRTWTSFMSFIPRNGMFPGLHSIKTWLHERRKSHPASLLSELSRLNRCLGFFFAFDTTRHDLKNPIYKFVNSILSDQEKKQAKIFTQSFLDIYCSQVGVYTGTTKKELTIAVWLIVGWFGGMRPGEESELTMDDFHMDSNGEGIWVRKLVGKALNGRESNYIWCLIPYNNNVNETDYASIVEIYIKRIIQDVGDASGAEGFPFWVHIVKGKFANSPCHIKWLRRCPKIAGLALNLDTVDLNGNSTRHSAATKLAEHDVSPINLLNFLGHRNIKTSNNYIKKTRKTSTNIMTLLNGKQPNGTLSQESIDYMNQKFTLALSYPSPEIIKSLLYSSNHDIIYRVLICKHFKITGKCDLLSQICKCYSDRRSQKHEGVPLSIYKRHLSPSINESQMLYTLSLLTDEELVYWPSLRDITEMRKKEVSVPLIMRRKLVCKQSFSFAPEISLAAHLLQVKRKESETVSVSQREIDQCSSIEEFRTDSLARNLSPKSSQELATRLELKHLREQSSKNTKKTQGQIMDSYRKIAPKLPSNTTGDQPDARRTMNTESTSSAGAIEELGLSNVIESQITVAEDQFLKEAETRANRLLDGPLGEPPELDFNDPELSSELLYGTNTLRELDGSQFHDDDEGAEPRREDVSVTMSSTVGNVGVFKYVGGFNDGLDVSDLDNADCVSLQDDKKEEVDQKSESEDLQLKSVANSESKVPARSNLLDDKGVKPIYTLPGANNPMPALEPRHLSNLPFSVPSPNFYVGQRNVPPTGNEAAVKVVDSTGKPFEVPNAVPNKGNLRNTQRGSNTGGALPSVPVLQGAKRRSSSAGSSRSGGTDAADPWSLKKCFMKRPPYLFGLGLTFRKPGRFPFYGMPNTTKLTNEDYDQSKSQLLRCVDEYGYTWICSFNRGGLTPLNIPCRQRGSLVQYKLNTNLEEVLAYSEQIPMAEGFENFFDGDRNYVKRPVQIPVLPNANLNLPQEFDAQSNVTTHISETVVSSASSNLPGLGSERGRNVVDNCSVSTDIDAKTGPPKRGTKRAILSPLPQEESGMGVDTQSTIRPPGNKRTRVIESSVESVSSGADVSPLNIDFDSSAGKSKKKKNKNKSSGMSVKTTVLSSTTASPSSGALSSSSIQQPLTKRQKQRNRKLAKSQAAEFSQLSEVDALKKFWPAGKGGSANYKIGYQDPFRALFGLTKADLKAGGVHWYNDGTKSDIVNAQSELNFYKVCKFKTKVASFDDRQKKLIYKDTVVFLELEEAVYFCNTVLKNRGYVLSFITSALGQQPKEMREYLLEVIFILSRQDLYQKFCTHDLIETGVDLFNEGKCFFKKNGNNVPGFASYYMNMKKYLNQLHCKVKQIRSNLES